MTSRRCKRSAWRGPAAIGVAVLVSSALSQDARGYPLDAAKATGISRLEGFRRAQKVNHVFPSGVELTSAEVKLTLADQPRFRIPPPDPEFTRQVVDLLGPDAGGYGIALLDLSDPQHPRYAAYNAERSFQPGSVGKLLTVLGLFQALADAHPDVEKRK